MKAIWNGAVLAESDETVLVEGNHYFPPRSIRREHFVESAKRTRCGWKGEASYYHLRVGERVHEDAAWSYLDPKKAAAPIAGYVAFWGEVRVVE